MYELWNSFMNSFAAPTTQGSGGVPMSGANYGFSPATSSAVNAGLQPSTVANPDSLRWWGGTTGDGAQVQGIVPSAIGAGSALAQTWLGFQNYGLAKDQLAFQQNAFNQNFAMQQDAYNTAKTNQTNTAAKQNA